MGELARLAAEYERIADELLASLAERDRLVEELEALRNEQDRTVEVWTTGTPPGDHRE